MMNRPAIKLYRPTPIRIPVDPTDTTSHSLQWPKAPKGTGPIPSFFSQAKKGNGEKRGVQKIRSDCALVIDTVSILECPPNTELQWPTAPKATSCQKFWATNTKRARVLQDIDINTLPVPPRVYRCASNHSSGI